MSRQDMADSLGLTIETVDRILIRLKREGLIALLAPKPAILRRREDLATLTSRDLAE